jgi:hypothetical protein
MAKTEISSKRVAINKANAQMVGIVSVAAFITVFCLFATKAALSQSRYQARVTTKKEAANKQLEENVKAFNQLSVSYKTFDVQATNVIGGNSEGQGDRDGKNPKIILDALPSTYDFPALTSSLEKVLGDTGLKVTGISGTDDQLNQQANLSSPNPQPVTVPFSFSITDANYGAVGQLITKMQQSIRPLQIDTISLAGSADSMTVTVSAHTYYQPAKNLNVTKQVVK